MKLKRKIFLIFSLVAVIPMIFLTTYTVVQYTHMIDNRMEDISHEQQENLSDAIDASYTSIRQVFMLLTFASNTDSSIIKILRPYADPEIHMTNMEIYRACLQLRNANQNIFYTYDFLNGVYVYTPSGNLISYETSKNGTIAQTYNPKNDDWYNRTIEPGGKMYYSRGLRENFETFINAEDIFFEFDDGIIKYRLCDAWAKYDRFGRLIRLGSIVPTDDLPFEETA